MGLDTSHDCWHGSYGSFNRWRAVLCQVAGLGSLQDYLGFGGSKEWPSKKDEPLVILLNHSDCDGKIYVRDLLPLANRLQELLDANVLKDNNYWCGNAVYAKTFIKGLRKAAKAKEPVDFH
jgi:pimeloyl-ACP methyl ester carboxylesterase